MISTKTCIGLVIAFTLIAYVAGYQTGYTFGETDLKWRIIEQAEPICVDIQEYRVCGNDENLNGMLDVEETKSITKL